MEDNKLRSKPKLTKNQKKKVEKKPTSQTQNIKQKKKVIENSSHDFCEDELNIIQKVDQSNAYCKSYIVYSILYTAIKIGLFEHLNTTKDFTTLEDIIKSCKITLTKRSCIDFLDILYTNKFLDRKNFGLVSEYKNSSDLFLNSNPDNLISFVKDRNRKCFDSIVNTSFIIENKTKDLKTPEVEKDEELYNEILTKNFIFHDNLVKLIENTPILSNFNSHVNLCYNSNEPKNENSLYSIINKKYSNLKSTYKVLSEVKDFTNFPNSDLYSASNVLHFYDCEGKEKILKEIFNSLNKGGLFLLFEDFVSEKRNELDEGLINSFYMLLNEDHKKNGGFGYNMSFSELKLLTTKVGFKEVQKLDKSTGSYAVLIYK